MANRDCTQSRDNSMQPSALKYIPPHKINTVNANVDRMGGTHLCFLCSEMHKTGYCTLAGKVMSSLMTCFICKNTSNGKGNTRHIRRPHYFNRKGRIIMESCPAITGVPQQSRVKFLEDIGHCPKCLSRADRCPSRLCSLGMDEGLRCPLETCPYRRSICPTPFEHMSVMDIKR